MSVHEFTAGFLFCGLGAGARGFLDAAARLGADQARFRNMGGVDNDPLSCADFEYLTGGKATCADLSKMQPADLRAAWGDRRPDAIFTSPPCKGFSGLLSAKSASAPKYQELNRLVLQGMFLACETWSEPPPVVVLENVPRITSRGADLLRQVRQLLAGYGYVFHEATHDCGEVGGLAQHRRRFLLVARHQKAMTAYIYRPPKKRVRACGEVLGELPLPEDPGAGELHRLPRLSWLNWVRLALIPAGGDWRDLPGMAPSGARFGHTDRVTPWDEPAGTVTSSPAPSSGGGAVADPRLAEAVGLARTAEGAATFKGRPGLFGVNEWHKPIPTVTGSATVSGSNGTAAVADPRLALNIGDPRRGGALGVIPWDEPAPTITGQVRTGSNTPSAVADPRLASPLEPGQERRAVWARYDVRPWDEPARTVAGEGSNGGFAVADPRTDRFKGSLGVGRWDEPAPTVAGESLPSNGKFSVADPRIGLSDNPTRHRNKYAVGSWDEPAPTVIGATRPGSGAPAVADPRADWFRGALGVSSWTEPAPTVTGNARAPTGRFSVADPRLKCAPRAGAYGVISWEEAAATVTGVAGIDNGPFAVADPRSPGEITVPVIIAQDGTWHRPLTTLELAALQGIPVAVNGEPLKLAGKSVAKWRERIGNAVPVQAACAIAETILVALLASALGTWTLGSTGIWVRDDGVTEDEANAEYEEIAA